MLFLIIFVIATVVASECPLAADHIKQGVRELNNDGNEPAAKHPIELMALSYQLKV